MARPPRHFPNWLVNISATTCIPSNVQGPNVPAADSRLFTVFTSSWYSPFSQACWSVTELIATFHDTVIALIFSISGKTKGQKKTRETTRETPREAKQAAQDNKKIIAKWTNMIVYTYTRQASCWSSRHIQVEADMRYYIRQVLLIEFSVTDTYGRKEL